MNKTFGQILTGIEQNFCSCFYHLILTNVIRTILVFFLFSAAAFGQSTYAPLNDDYYYWIDRYEVKAGRTYAPVFTSVKPYKRSAIVSFMDTVKRHGLIQSSADQFNYEYLMNDSWEWSRAESSVSKKTFLKHFYKRKADLFHVDEEDFDLHINPVFYVGAGSDSRRDDRLFMNTRGVEVRGMVDRRVGFYTYLADNQVLLPQYVREYNSLVPHEGFYKRYKEGEAVDFLQARGYITFETTEHVSFQFGHDRIFLGNGYRSLVFSDFAPPALFLKGNVKVWKLNYLFQLNQMTADTKGANGYPVKFNALHHLSVNVGKKLNIGIFESVIFSPDDSTGTDRFRLEYLNPIIFYRAIEQQNGSTDNVMLGLDFKWHMLKKFSIYGQFLLDELVVENVRAGNGWWANKYGIQFGGKYVDAFGIPNLDFQGEVNIVRPFTYSHYTNYGNYSHYRQPIAHPLGANFNELIGIVRYQPLPKLNVTGKLFLVEAGRDSIPDVSWGGDILKNNQLRVQEFDNQIGQGVSNTILYGNLVVSWYLKHNLFVDANLLLRKSESKLPLYHNNSTVLSLSLRWNMARPLYEF